MIIEYSHYDLASSDAEIKEELTQAGKYAISTVSVLPQSLRLAKTLIPEHIFLSTPIDYPTGSSDLRSRLSMCEYAIKSGASKLDVVVPTHAVCNRKYDKFRDDIKSILDLTLSHNVSVRYILEYRIFTYETLYKIAQILEGFGIYEIFPSSGFFLDNIMDNILAAGMINKKVPKMNIICNGNIWNLDQIGNINKLNLYGIRLNSLNGLDLACKKMTN